MGGARETASCDIFIKKEIYLEVSHRFIYRNFTDVLYYRITVVACK